MGRNARIAPVVLLVRAPLGIIGFFFVGLGGLFIDWADALPGFRT